ncbi:DNA mismatch endonuclease Vsr [Solimonas sp. K1W22B-7]|uniref:very short patch repair endonuclease n=1 Tax=Solimonas sp. K1W22B-7 TaxID=2303331 RepID=UPI000E336A26|nr:very short patch repair endonuclease [Solimonas sp. K1W22B-7]AXQ27477.1 DNA mismatch endonuclease Vsr [Solimonas sp. K1W22B-7]
MDTLSEAARSRNMSRIRASDTAPERLLRRLVWATRKGYRLNLKSLPGKPDIAFTKAKLAIFMHGCFWHGHERCRRANTPKSNTHYWAPKIEGNRRRDAANVAALGQGNWDVLVVWECELKNPEEVTRRLQHFLKR